MKNGMRMVLVLAGMVSAMAAQAAEVRGTRAKELNDLIQPTGSTSGVLVVTGYITEKPTPPIRYEWASFGPSVDQIVTLKSQVNLQNVAATLSSAGIPVKYYEGGTTYVEFTAQVECATEDLCQVNPLSSR